MLDVSKLKNAYNEIVRNRRELDGWDAYRVGYLNSWNFYYEGVRMGNVTVLSNGILSFKD